jgi:hypothetical protein
MALALQIGADRTAALKTQIEKDADHDASQGAAVSVIVP